MINEQELQISNKSYTNKDFASIYQEILDLAKKLSNRFDPEVSNESDPFIVLLKLLAFIGDKINYNIDKNILERFMPSATQESSMRNLCEMMGYNMHYYIAPETTITIQYVGKEKLNDNKYFIIPRYSAVSNSKDESENKVTYIIKNRDVVVNENEKVYGSGKDDDALIIVIEGQLKTLSILGDEKIHLENLDDNNRIYFPEQEVAENGVFISGGVNSTISSGLTEWIKIDNLNLRDNLFVYSFGFDSSKNLPYIEFPENIADLIGDGLTIKYVITSGELGNIKSKVLNCLSDISSLPNKFNTNESINISELENGIYPLNIVNINAATNGKNPESINDAYKGFKKTIGTFDTLVTCRDYMNYIYNLLDEDEIYSLVSNIMVSDRRTDINYGTQIVTFNEYGQTVINQPSEDITAYDLCLYPLQPIKNNTLDEYTNSFRRLTDLNEIKSRIEYSKSISHDYKQISLDDIYLIKNYLTLNCKIATTYKVNDIERLDIINNVNTALIRDYNSRNIDYGYEIPYELLQKTIENADNRIKSITLYEPDLNTKVMLGDNEELDLETSSNFITIIAKNILAGRYYLFDYDTRFDYDFCQEKITNKDMIINNIKSVTTNTIINLSSTETELKENQQLQIIYPSLITDITYPYGQNYASNFVTSSNETKVLDSGEYLALFWTNSSNIQQYKLYREGDIIKTNFALINTVTATTGVINYDVSSLLISSSDQAGLIDLGLSNNKINVKQFANASNQIEHQEYNKETLTKQIMAYWLLNTENNTFTFDSNNEYILDAGEYFYRTDNSFNSLYIYGPGTSIKKEGNVVMPTVEPIENISDINEKGLLSVKQYFKPINLTNSNYLIFQENSILTLNVEDKVKLTDSSYSVNSNTFEDFNDYYNKFQYKLAGTEDFIFLEDLIGISDGYRIRSRLNINSGPNLYQKLSEGDKIIFKDKDNTLITFEPGVNEEYYINLSELRQLAGGDNINLADINYLVSETSENRIKYISCYDYKYTLPSNNFPSKNNQGYREIEDEYSSIKIPEIENKNILLMIYNKTDNPCTLSCTNSSGGGIREYYTQNSFNNSLSITSGLTVLELKGVKTISIAKISNEDIDLIISKLDVLNGINSNIPSNIQSSVISKINDLDIEHNFYYNYIPDNIKLINEESLLNPYTFYDYNNIYNKWVLSEIDFETSIIDVMRGSRV